MYVLKFEPTIEGRRNYEIYYQAIVMTNKEVTRDNEDDFIMLLRKFKKIGVEAAERMGKISLYDLSEEGGEVKLERSEHKLLTQLVEAPIWRPAILEQKRDAQDYLKSIKDDSTTNAKDAKPEQKRRQAANESGIAGSIPGEHADG